MRQRIPAKLASSAYPSIAFGDSDPPLVDVSSPDPASPEGVNGLEVHGQTYIKRMRMTGALEARSGHANIKTVDELNGGHRVRILGCVA